MALICTTTRTWVTRNILDPVRRWVNRRRRTCGQRRRWWQRLICWLVTILVQITEWVTRNILVPILNTICRFVSWLIGYPLLIIAAIFGAVNFRQWVLDWFITPTSITFVNREEDPNNPESFIYTFTCNCNNSTLTISAQNDNQAQLIAIEECRDRC